MYITKQPKGFLNPKSKIVFPNLNNEVMFRKAFESEADTVAILGQEFYVTGFAVCYDLTLGATLEIELYAKM